MTLAARAAGAPYARMAPERSATARAAHVVDVSRPQQRPSWTSAAAAPFELLALAWSVPVLISLLMLPIAAALALALWIGRTIAGQL